MRINKRGRIFFLWLAVALSSFLLITLYRNHLGLMNDHESYIAGELVGNTVNAMVRAEVWKGYIDSSALHTMNTLGVRPFMKAQCLSAGGIPIAKAGCFPQRELYYSELIAGFKQEFPAYLEPSLLDDSFYNGGKAIQPPGMPADWEFYILNERLHGVGYGEFVFEQEGSTLIEKPAFVVPLQIPFKLIEDTFSRAREIQEECAPIADYQACIEAYVEAEPDWELDTAASTEYSALVRVNTGRANMEIKEIWEAELQPVYITFAIE